MLIRPMQTTDLPEIIAIEKLSFSEPWSYSAFEEDLLNPTTYYYVWVEDDEIQGYAGFWKILDEGNITNIAFAPEHRGKGKGKRLVAFLKQAACELGIKELILEVRESNTRAIRAYQDNGFSVIGLRKDYYTNPSENALLMRANVLKEATNEHGTENN